VGLPDGTTDGSPHIDLIFHLGLVQPSKKHRAILAEARGAAWLLYIWCTVTRHRDVKHGAESVSVEGKRQ
jgi:hypothetical protein